MRTDAHVLNYLLYIEHAVRHFYGDSLTLETTVVGTVVVGRDESSGVLKVTIFGVERVGGGAASRALT